MTNPFSTRRTRPGALPYLSATGDASSGTALVERLDQTGWWGEIVGPHGTGKTTLLHSLTAELQRRDRELRWFTLHRDERRLPLSRGDVRRWTSRTQVVVDGFEQLPWWRRRGLIWQCRRRGAGLLVTAHRTCGLPTLVTTDSSPALTRRIVRHLWPEHDRLINDREIDACLRQNGGNVRETLFGLYDLYERRTR